MTDDRREWYIYVLRDPRDDEVRYVGFTTDVAQRLKDHIGEATRGIHKSHKNHWIGALVKLDLLPIIEVIERGIGEWQSVERYWILHHRMQGTRLTNGTIGGDGVVGHKLSPEHIEKVRQSNLGRKQSPESIEKRRQSNRGFKHSPESIEKTRQANIGKKRTPEQIKEMSERKASPETRERMRKAQTRRHGIPVRRVEDGMIFASAGEAARSISGSRQNIHSAITTRGTCAGYHWERVGETPPADPYTLDGNALMMRID